MMVKIPLNAIKNTVGPSPIPNHTIASGTHAMIGTCLKELINGDIMVEAQGRLQTEKVIAYMILAGVIGFLIDAVMVLVEKILLRWKAA